MRDRNVPRWMRGTALITTGAFVWSLILATPVAALTHAKTFVNPLVRKLTDAEMNTIIGTQPPSNVVPQAGSGPVNYNGSQAPGSGLWDILRVGDSTVVATNAVPNGWLAMFSGSASVSAPGSASLGAHRVRYKAGVSSFYSGDFTVVQPATSYHSGSALPWEVPGRSKQPSDPISPPSSNNPFNGNKTTVLPIVGWTARGGLPVSLSLVHNSLSNSNLTLGSKWTHSYDIYLLVDGSGNVTTHFGDDSSYQFTYNYYPGTYTATTGIYDTLVKNVGNTYTLTTKNKVVYQFNTSLRCTSITDRNGNAITLGYSGNNVVTITDPTSRVLTIGYTSGKITSVTDPLSRVWNIEYDGNGRVYKVKLPLLSGQMVNSFTQFQYDGNNNISTLTTPRGKAWTFSYFSDSSLQWEKDPYLNQTSYNYTTTTKTITDPNGNVTTLTYNSNGELTQEKDPLNKTINFTYNTAHNRLTVQDKRTYTNTMTYDSMGNMLTFKNPYNKTWTYTYTAKNDVDTVTDPLTHVADYGYNAAGNLTSVTDALSHVTDYTVNGNGLTTEMKTYPVGGTTLTTTYAYNTNGHLEQVTDPLSHSTYYTPDGIGRVTEVEDALTHATTTVYDNWGRASSVTSPAGTTNYTYDYDGNITHITDANSHNTTFAYDDAGRITTKTLANGDVMTYTYDAIGKKGLLSSQTNGNGRTTTFTYTTRNQMASATYPVSSSVNTSESWTYNDAGQIATRVDCKSVTKSYAYDNASRLITIDYPTGTDTSFTYDDASRQTGMTDSTGTTGITYDNADRVTQIVSPNGTVSYGYDSSNRRTTTTISGSPNLVTTYTFDAASRVTQITNPYSENTTFTYDNANRMTKQTFSTGSYTDYVYDNANRPTDIFHKKSGGTTIDRFQYDYDGVGNVTERTDTNGDTVTYGYDLADQLTSEVKTGTNAYNYAYAYDDNRNRTSKTVGGVTTTNYVYDWQDRLQTATTGANVKSYFYDFNGNCNQVKWNGTTTVTLSYDYENRVSGISYAAGGSNSFTYNGLNLRQSKVDSVGTKTYVTDGISPASPVLKDGSAVYTPGISERRGSTSSFYHADSLGSTRNITGTTQTSTDTLLTDAFGGNVNRTGTNPTPFGFAGQYQYQWDDQSKLMLLGNRYYDPEAGRFLSKDPIKAGGNWYAYCENNPLSGVDSLGLEKNEGVIATIGRIIGHIWTLPNTALGALGGIGGDWKYDPVHEAWNVQGGWLANGLFNLTGTPALTLGDTILWGVPFDPDIADHEHEHLPQYKWAGPFFLPLYGLGAIGGWLLGDAHDGNPFELGADWGAGHLGDNSIYNGSNSRLDTIKYGYPIMLR